MLLGNIINESITQMKNINSLEMQLGLSDTSAATEKLMQPHRNIIKLFLIPSRFSGKQRTYFFSPNTTPDIRTETSLRT